MTGLQLLTACQTAEEMYACEAESALLLTLLAKLSATYTSW